MVSKFIIRGGSEMVEEHLIYFSSAGLALIFGYIIYQLTEYKKVLGIVVLLLLLGAYGRVTIARNRVWLSGESLYKSMIESAPNAIQGHVNMGLVYLRNQDIENGKRELNTAYKIDRFDPDVLNALGKIAFREGRYQEAAEYFGSSIEAWPARTQTSKLYALALAAMGEWQEITSGVGQYLIQIYPNDMNIRYMMALSYYKQNDLANAKIYFDWNRNLTEDQKIKELEEFKLPTPDQLSPDIRGIE